MHRPKYDDWSFPKGKVDPGEHVTTAAVREVAEETGVDIRLGPPLPRQCYPIDTGTERTKKVHYWAGRVVGDDDVSAYRANAEVDAVTWVRLDRAAEQLTYRRDRETLADFEQVRRKTHPLVVLRHAKARSRKSWKDDDRERPLNDIGLWQAEALVPVLGAFGVRRILSSSSRRCWTTVSPYADVADLEVEVTRRLSEQDAHPGAVARQVRRLLDHRQPSVLCTHRPVLPMVFDALGVEERKLDAAAMLVVHHRRGAVVTVEEHHPA